MKRLWKAYWWVLGIVLVLGSVVFLTWDTLSFLPGTVSAQGTVLPCERHVRRGSCHPSVSFQTPSGERRVFRPSSGSWRTGDHVTVLYHPNNPSDARVAWDWLQALVQGLAAYLIVGGLLLVSYILLKYVVIGILLAIQKVWVK
jgi:hypothetical protein